MEALDSEGPRLFLKAGPQTMSGPSRSIHYRAAAPPTLAAPRVGAEIRDFRRPGLFCFGAEGGSG